MMHGAHRLAAAADALEQVAPPALADAITELEGSREGFHQRSAHDEDTSAVTA